MQLIVHGRNVEVTDWIREYVNKKVGRLERYLNQVSEARIELSHNATRAADDRFTAQLTIWANGNILRAEESTADIVVSIDAVVDKMSRQIRRFKGRRYQSRRRQSAAAAVNAEAQLTTALVEDLGGEEDEEMGNIIRRKEFLLQPMDEEEALAQMELLGHDFFIYYDVDAKGVNVVYRRRDGQFGLLQPRVG
ncbi:MAG: ribosome-associated translation inhibitor RaiA [Caldilineaceae bacterium]|nr:ribosome-associated translation inhibitor RaiA [Caldilineaceae bacterium]